MTKTTNKLLIAVKNFLSEFDDASDLLEMYPDDLAEARIVLINELENWK